MDSPKNIASEIYAGYDPSLNMIGTGILIFFCIINFFLPKVMFSYSNKIHTHFWILNPCFFFYWLWTHLKFLIFRQMHRWRSWFENKFLKTFFFKWQNLCLYTIIYLPGKIYLFYSNESITRKRKFGFQYESFFYYTNR